MHKNMDVTQRITMHRPFPYLDGVLQELLQDGIWKHVSNWDPMLLKLEPAYLPLHAPLMREWCDRVIDGELANLGVASIYCSNLLMFNKILLISNKIY